MNLNISITLDGQPVAVVAAPATRPANAGQRFQDLGDSILDRTTGLEWTKATIAKDVTFDQAQKLASAVRIGDHSDWRLPVRTELLTLVDDTRHEPAIDTAAFPDTANDWYWSSSPAAWSPSDGAWVVSFSYGLSFDFRRGYRARVRAVRVAGVPGQ